MTGFDPSSTLWQSPQEIFAVLHGRQHAALGQGSVTAPGCLAWSSWAYGVDGDSDRAIGVQEQVFAAPGYVTAAHLRIDPHYASLRGQPRFEQLLRR